MNASSSIIYSNNGFKSARLEQQYGTTDTPEHRSCENELMSVPPTCIDTNQGRNKTASLCLRDIQ